MASSASAPATPGRFVRRALLCCAGVLALWLMGQAVPAAASGERPRRAAAAAEQQEVLDSVAVSDSAAVAAAGASAEEKAREARSADGRGVLASSSGNETFSFSWGHAAALLLLGGGGAYALWLRSGGGAAGATRTFRPVGQYALGAQDQQVRLVECGGEVLLLGVTAQEVTLLKTYPREAFEGHPALAEEPDAAEAAAALPDGGLADAFRHVLQQRASA